MNNELDVHPHPLIYAYNLQKKIQAMKDDIAGMEVEYNQIVQYCTTVGLTNQDGFAIKAKQSIRRTIDPVLFAMDFPDANDILVSKYAAFIGTELDKLVTTKILPSIKIEDAKELVGNAILDKACKFSITEKISIVKEDTI
jgi:hypothetical protein